MRSKVVCSSWSFAIMIPPHNLDNNSLAAFGGPLGTCIDATALPFSERDSLFPTAGIKDDPLAVDLV